MLEHLKRAMSYMLQQNNSIWFVYWIEIQDLQHTRANFQFLDWKSNPGDYHNDAHNKRH